ncbi:MAG: enoyl-CoA hydratase/isomerase family protein [Oscillospiraceae bacterium]|nr:enoyl-CoA hydratase/isomerase family protein [Oscillospiraceae bacterium]
MDFQYLKYELRDGIAWVTIDRPEQRNALNRATLLELIDAFKRVDADEDVRVAILTGAGKVFVGGADLNELSVMSALDYLDYGNLYNVLNRLIREGGKPVIGAVNGHALGGGNVMILSCDIIVASERAKFAVPEINLGIFGGASVLPRLVGRYQAAEMVLLGEAYTAQKAYELGLVNRVVPPEEVVSTAQSIAEGIRAKSPLAVRMAKRALILGNQYEPGAASEMQLPIMSLLYSGHDQKEGMRAFFEKRAPEYTGR